MKIKKLIGRTIQVTMWGLLALAIGYMATAITQAVFGWWGVAVLWGAPAILILGIYLEGK